MTADNPTLFLRGSSPRAPSTTPTMNAFCTGGWGLSCLPKTRSFAVFSLGISRHLILIASLHLCAAEQENNCPGLLPKPTVSAEGWCYSASLWPRPPSRGATQPGCYPARALPSQGATQPRSLRSTRFTVLSARALFFCKVKKDKDKKALPSSSWTKRWEIDP